MVWAQWGRPRARAPDWRHWPRSTNTSHGAKRSPRPSTKRTAIPNSRLASTPTQLATHPTSQNATIRRAKQRASTSTCNTTPDLGAGCRCPPTAWRRLARPVRALKDRPTEANSLEAPLAERRLGVTPPTRQTLPDAALVGVGRGVLPMRPDRVRPVRLSP